MSGGGGIIVCNVVVVLLLSCWPLVFLVSGATLCDVFLVCVFGVCGVLRFGMVAYLSARGLPALVQCDV